MLLGALLSLAILVVAMGAAAVIAEQTRRSGFIDGIWAISTGAATLTLILTLSGPFERPLVISALVAIWAVRLGRHLVTRTLKSGADDPRYAALRRDWGEAAPRKLFVFLQMQAIAGWLLALSAAAAAARPGPLDWQDGLGVAIVLIALFGEWQADRQLAAFRRDKAGAVCDRGLWGWSRHPNYFFEWLVWVGIAVIGIAFDGRTALVLVAPVSIYWLLVHVSGIPPLERHMLESRGETFRAYQRRVSPFFPIKPKTIETERDS
ncbi:hypothetical protein CXZ10_07965 [Pleomorphomonas diazotrophica]|uniref:Steroid 5-alpha reductase C-terminal domain-containing protein n=1 Tax=Pleomorphomonas diazotrophica TaxID=1166257 RepID=A0A1I4UTZ4_9HYPH|nr:DUF1295 domain-containing protein [Pleomorphomonas diazotrophica]PKR89822.1 hypothetical protein CXZ10_07965 [Pleomorphomonas diazotrophica]SFM92469.1 Steroid 5-alpha reductase family enzyme [Pleomorphomonas diazotrophica]